MSVKEARRTLKRAYSDFQFHLDENEVSRKELAEVIGTSEQYVSRLVNGREDSKAAKEKLMTSAQNLFAKMYEANQAAGGAAGAGPDMGAGAGSDAGAQGGSTPYGDDVVDGDYKEV